MERQTACAILAHNLQTCLGVSSVLLPPQGRSDNPFTCFLLAFPSLPSHLPFSLSHIQLPQARLTAPVFVVKARVCSASSVSDQALLYKVDCIG